MRGSKPKPEEQRRRRNKPVHDWQDVLDVPFAGGPKLPSKRPNGTTWPAWTRRWWKTVSAMPHCKDWQPSDWEFAFDTAALKAEFVDRGGNALAAEVRNRERVLGTTAEFRRDLRIRYVDTDGQRTEQPAGVTNLDDYRDL